MIVPLIAVPILMVVGLVFKFAGSRSRAKEQCRLKERNEAIVDTTPKEW